MTELEKKVNFEYTKKEDSYRYMLLDRMRGDCEYFLENGNGFEGHLWAGNVEDHIMIMKEIWNSFEQKQKPEWLSMEDIIDYENRMSDLKIAKFTLEERYANAMELAGYERTDVPEFPGIYTVAFKHIDTGELIQSDGWEMLGEKLENLKPLSEANMNIFEKLIHPEGRISFYCKNLGGTGLGTDRESIIYPNLDGALKAYLSVETDGRILGYKIGDEERVITRFDIVDMQNHFVKDGIGIGFFDGLTVNEKQYMREVLDKTSIVLNKDNAYQAIYDGISTVALKCAADISSGKTEWGAWMGHIANTHRPQDYVDVDIAGYVRVHEVHCNISVIHANEIVSSKQVIIKTDSEHMENSIRNGIEDAVKQLDSYMHEAVNLLDTDNEYQMCLYSPYTVHTLQEHYTILENAGYTTFPIINKNFKEMTKEDVRSYIKNFFKQYDEELMCTSRVLDSLATTVIKMIDSGQLDDSQDTVKDLLTRDAIINFIKQRAPLVDKVSDEVKNSVKAYFEENLKNFTPIAICRASNHPEDSNLYAVIARQADGKYACWTSWQQARETMNYGHYSLPDKEAALSIVKDNFNDISDEMEKYGPDQSLVTVNLAENVEKQNNEKSVVLPFVNKGRGR